MTESYKIYVVKAGRRFKFRIEFQPQQVELIGQTIHKTKHEALLAGAALLYGELLQIDESECDCHLAAAELN